MRNNNLFSKTLHKFKKDLISAGAQDLRLPLFDKIDVKALQIFHKKTNEEHQVQKLEWETNLSDEFGFVFAGNHLTKVQIPQNYLEQGLKIMDLNEAFENHYELLSTYFAKMIKPREDLLTYEHYCRLTGGVFIMVPDELKIKETLQGYFDYQANVSHSTQVVMVIGKNAELSFTENEISQELGNGDYSNFFEVFSLPGSQLSYVINDQSATAGHNYFYRSFTPEDHAVVNLTSGEFTQGNVLVNNKITLKGNDSVGEVKTVAIAQKKQLEAINSRVTNVGLRTKGNILQHGVILDHAKLVFNGIGQIIKGSRGSDSQQENRVLMLSEKARGDANPILLIDENDVTAGHAASVGRIDSEQLYYLESRGLDEDTAKRLIIKGFLESVITVVTSQRTQKMLRSVIERSLQIDDS